MDIKVQRMVAARGNTNAKAFADISIGGVFAVHGVRVVEGKNGPFVSLPAQKGNDGKYYETAHPITKEGREALDAAVLGAYRGLEQGQDGPER